MAYYSDDPRDQLIKRRDELLKKAETAQSQGDIKEYAYLNRQAETLWEDIEDWEAEQGHS